MTTYFFPDCRLNVSDAGVTTAYFFSGDVLERLPRPIEDRTTARWLGYGSDVRRFHREHDVLLHTLAVWQGQGCSPKLLADTCEVRVNAPFSDEFEEEDTLCGRVHRWLNLDLWDEEIGVLLVGGIDKRALRDFLRAVLEGEITIIDAP